MATRAASLAERLRELRERRWPDLAVTQGMVAEALGVSTALVSSWESATSPKTPPVYRLSGYARFFATRRSVESGPRLLDDDELTDDERTALDRLESELFELRTPSSSGRVVDVRPARPSGTWTFDDDAPVCIVSTRLPVEMLARLDYTDPSHPNHIALLSYADVDALVELQGHLRARNPDSTVSFKTPEQVQPDDLSGHVVLLGGIAWNSVTQWFTGRIEPPVSQVTVPGDLEADHFVTDAGGRHREFRPTFRAVEGHAYPQIVYDVGMFVRGPNPINLSRTVTMCNGIFSRGTYGVVRMLTDAALREKNEQYLSDRFEDVDTYGLLVRVPVVMNVTATPDLTRSYLRLFEWPDPPKEADA